MTGNISRRVDEMLLELSPDLLEIAERNVRALRDAIDLSRLQLAGLLEDELADPRLRSTAAWVIGVVGEASLVGHLSRVFRNTRETVVLWEVAKALCALGAGVAVFRSAIEAGPSPEHRKAAAFSLGCMRDTESVALLAEVLSGRKEPIEVRGQVAEALGYIGDPRAFAALAKAALDQSAEIRFWSVFALGTLGDERARPILERLERDDLAIVEGWGTVADEAALALEELTKRDDYD